VIFTEGGTVTFSYSIASCIPRQGCDFVFSSIYLHTWDLCAKRNEDTMVIDNLHLDLDW